MDGEKYLGYYFVVEITYEAVDTVMTVGCMVKTAAKPDCTRKGQAFVTTSRQTRDEDGKLDTLCMTEKAYEKERRREAKQKRRGK